MTDLGVSEIFSSIQGEGPNAGRAAAFLRLGGCNLQCSWCDTPYTWRWHSERYPDGYDPGQEVSKVSVSAVAGMVRDHLPGLPDAPDPLLIVTGGEPLLQQTSLVPLFDVLAELVGRKLTVQFETNGTIGPLQVYFEPPEHWPRMQFVVSPKLANAGMPALWRARPVALSLLAAQGAAVHWKFVCCEPRDLAEVEAFLQEWRIQAPVWIMPEGKTWAAMAQTAHELVGHVERRGWRLALRQHLLFWDGMRGR